jgi:hypothetical protein
MYYHLPELVNRGSHEDGKFIFKQTHQWLPPNPGLGPYYPSDVPWWDVFILATEISPRVLVGTALDKSPYQLLAP